MGIIVSSPNALKKKQMLVKMYRYFNGISFIFLIGIAIVGGQPSSLGKFQHNCDGTWKDVNITNSIPLGKIGHGLTAIFLRPNNSLRFNLSSVNSFWRMKEGKMKASLKILAWDMSNNMVCGMKIFNSTEVAKINYISKFQGVADLIQLRKGCNQRPGSIPYVDACNVCMGDNSTCTGCDGKINSTATFGRFHNSF